MENRISNKDFRSVDVLGCAYLASLVFLFCFRAHWAFSINLKSDEGCYLRGLSDWIGLGFDQICSGGNYFAPGLSFLWVPAGLLGKGLAAIGGGNIQEWVLPAVALYSFLAWAAALYLLARILQSRFPRMKNPPLTALLLLLNTPCLYYATHRPLMSHTFELLLACGVLVALNSTRYLLAMGLALALTLLRYNDAPSVFLVLGVLLDRARSSEGKWEIDRFTPLLKASSIAAGIFVLTLLVYIGVYRSYGGLTLARLLNNDYRQGAYLFFLSADFGILWSQPAWLGIFLFASFRFSRLSYSGRAALGWMLAEMLLCIFWQGTGSDFAYRYLIGSYAAAFWLLLELLASLENWRRSFRLLLTAGAVWSVYLSTIYKTVSWLGPHRDPSGLVVNPTFLWEALRAPWHFDVFQMALAQQLPWVTLYLSWVGSGTKYDHLAVQGPALGYLTLACAIAGGVLMAKAVRSAFTRLLSSRSTKSQVNG